MRIPFVLSLLLMVGPTSAQQVDWLVSSPVGYTLNPGMPDQSLASAPGHLVGMRTVNSEFVFGQSVYGSVALDALDPATGTTWLSCLLLDSVAVGAAVVAPAGIAYFSGRFTGDVLEFCDGSQLPGIGGFLAENHFLMAWNLNTGMPLWSRNLSATNPDITDVPSLAVDPDGNLWYSAVEFFDGHLVQVDFWGNDVQTRTVSGIRRFGTLSFDPWGGLYVSGSCEDGTLTFAGQGFPVSSVDGYNMFVLRYRPDGTAGFAEFADDVTFTNPTVVATNDGHAYLAGDLFLSGTSWGGISFQGPNWVYDTFLTRLDSSGQFLWGVESAPNSTSITGDMYRAKGPCVTVDVNGNACLMGTLRGLVAWGNGVVSDGLTVGAQTMTIVSFAQDGTPQWAATSTPGGMFNQAQTLTAMAAEGTLHFAGHITAQFTFGAHTTNVGGTQAAMVGRIGDLGTGVREHDGAQPLAVWPNPAADVLYVEIDRSLTMPSELLNSAGQCVRSFALISGRNAVDMGGLSPGLYLLHTADGSTARVVVE